MAFDLDHALRYLIAAEGSDLHLKVPAYPLVRLHGHLEAIPGTERLFPEDTAAALQHMLDDPDKLAEFDSENEVDFSYAVEAGREIRAELNAELAVVLGVQRLADTAATLREALAARGAMPAVQARRVRSAQGLPTEGR